MKKYTILVFQCFVAVLLFSSCGKSLPKSNIEIVKKENGFDLYIDGDLTYINGVGGTNRLDIASESGANAFRTWGGDVASIQSDLNLARKNKMYIMQGIDLTKDSTKYHDEDYKNLKRAEVRTLAETFKDEPNILSWGLGNEIDHEEKANTRTAWEFVEELAQLIKSIDKKHLVSTVITHNPKALDNIAKYAPSVDYVGVNSYGAINTLKEMFDNSTYQGPFMVTEWGPTGFWEMPKTEWKADIEQTSEEKRIVYEERYNKYIRSNPRCLGSFVFLWAQKEERTPTWFSMFVENDVEGLPLKGEKTPMVEAMQRVWTGAELKQTAPVLDSFMINGKKSLENAYIKPGTIFNAEVKVADKENDTLRYVWEILHEATVLGSGGSYEPRPDRVGDVSTTSDPTYSSVIKTPGAYRLYVYVLDNTGFVATANIPFKVQ